MAKIYRPGTEPRGLETYRIIGNLEKFRGASMKVHVEEYCGKFGFYLTDKRNPFRFVEAESGPIYDRRGDARRSGKSLKRRLKNSCY